MAKDDNGYLNNFEDATVTLSLDDGVEVECSILAVFPVNDKDYIALLPQSKDGKEPDEVYLYGYKEDANGEPSLINITDDDEYEMVVDAFDELMDEDEYDEFIEDDDDDLDDK